MEKIKDFLRQRWVQKGGAILLALFVWQVVSLAIGEVLILPTPIAVLARLCTIWYEPGFFSSVGLTVLRITLGFLLAFALGVLLALAAGRSRAVETILFPYMAVVKAVPVACFIVLLYVWLSSRSIVPFIAFLIVLPTVYTGVLSGIRAKDKGLEEMADVFGVSPVRRFLSVRLPQLESYVISAVSLGAGLAFKSGIAAEILSLPSGSVGEMLYYASLWLQSVDLYAWTVVLVLVSIAFEKLAVLLCRLVFQGVRRI